MAGTHKSGGARKGGRKLGATTRVTREISDKLAADGEIMPLEIILRTARAMWKDAQEIDEKTGQPTINLAKAKEAAVVADRALAYCHARIGAQEAPAAETPEKPDETTALEEARLLAFAITKGIRERSKQGALPKPKAKA